MHLHLHLIVPLLKIPQWILILLMETLFQILTVAPRPCRIGPLLCLRHVMSSVVRSVVCVQILGNANFCYAPKFGTCFPISLIVLPLCFN